MTIPANIPAHIGRLLRSGALMALSLAAQGVEQTASSNERATRPEAYEPDLKRFDAARALLDALGWQDTESEDVLTLDTGPHRPALAEAAQLAIEHDEPSAEDAETLKAFQWAASR